MAFLPMIVGNSGGGGSITIPIQCVAVEQSTGFAHGDSTITIPANSYKKVTLIAGHLSSGGSFRYRQTTSGQYTSVLPGTPVEITNGNLIEVYLPCVAVQQGVSTIVSGSIKIEF